MDNLDSEIKPEATAKLPDKQRYIVTTYSGNERKVAENIERRIDSMGLKDYVFRVVVAEEKEPDLDKNGKQKMVKDKETGVEVPKFKIKNLYPGYVFVEMIMTDESRFMIRNTPRVTGIAGSSGGGQKPTPVSGKEIETVLKRMGMVDNSMYDRYHVGDLVKVIHGTFNGMSGNITSIDKETGEVTIDAIFFGRHTSVEVEFSEVVKV
jgi:transcriptional antiterminator NusG